MNVDMGIKDFVKYPRYLKTYHDIVLKNYKVKLDDIKNNKYLKLKELKSNLNFSKDNYEVIIPNSLQDIVIEGSTLNHCVASYIDKVLDNQSFICFMRDKKQIDKPLITLEIVGGYIVHCKGQSNRNPYEEEAKFLTGYQVYLNRVFKNK